MNIPLTPLRCLRYAEAQFPDRPALVCEGHRSTYAQFGERVGRLAGALRSLGLKPGERVAFLSTNCHRLLEAYYGVLEAGGVLLPLNIRLAASELAYILADSEARFLFVESPFLSVVESFRSPGLPVESYFLLDGQPSSGWLDSRNYEALLDAATPYRRELMEVDEDSLAELFYTSGTSANPKGVMLTHRNIYLHALSVSLAFRPSSETVALHTIPLFHANGWGVAHSLTLAGGVHVMIKRFDPVEFYRLVEQEKIQCCEMVPAMATALVHCPELSRFNVSSLQRITIGGAASSPTLMRAVEEKLGCTCFAGYGLTETSPVLTTSPMKFGLHWKGEDRYVGQSMTGFPIPGVQLRIVDDEGNDVPHDGVSMGEVVALGDGVMAGYWRQPEATRDAMRTGWFHTGDVGTMNRDGYLLIVDRKKDIIVSGGENISSLEVEKALLAHPGVYEAAVIPVPDTRWGEVPKGIVVLKPGAQVSEMELIEFCRSRLAHFKVPKSMEFIESLPKTGTGKVLKKELRAQYRPR